jgi:hypothetical protein
VLTGRFKYVLVTASLLTACIVGGVAALHSAAGSPAVQRPAAAQRGLRSGAAIRHPAKHQVFFGISDPLLIHLPAKRQLAELSRMRSIGINSVRFDANWSWVQYGGPRSYDWTMLDTEVHSALAEHMSVLLVIDGCPSWAAAAGAARYAEPSPASAVEFATWAAAVAHRYGPMGVKYFEIWNEPNDSKFWQPRANPVFYARMLKASYQAIKKADKSAYVIAGGLAPVESKGGSLSAIAFLRSMYAHGAKPYFNAIATHPYSFPALPQTYEPWSAWSQMAQTTPSLRSVMARYKDSGKPIWITEFGAPSDGPNGVGANGEAAELRQAIALAKSTRWIRAIYIYTWQDAGTKTWTNADWFGLLNFSGRTKPAYQAVAKAIR